MKKMLTIAAIAATFTACKKDLPTTEGVATPIENGTNATNPAGYDYTSYDDFGNANNNGGFWAGNIGYYERVTWPYLYEGVSTKFAQNVSGRAKAPTGWQRIDANLPDAGNTYGAYMRIQSYNPSGGSCFPFPKIQMATIKEYNKISRLQSSVNVTVPTTGDRRFNTAFDIYFDKTGQMYPGGNYLAMMVWLNKSWPGQTGMAGERLKWWNTTTNSYDNIVTIDGTRYYLVGRKDFTSNDMIINFVCETETTVDGNINILNLMRFLCPQNAVGRIFHYTDGAGAQTLQPNLSGAKLVDYNFGFEIWKSENTAGVDRSQKALTFTINRFVTDYAVNP